ncbi:hypothetical protein [Alkalibacterium olivapovliticus]|uniref:Uncharacterized protein n=1 Tax=Alkalibacterium olivapovliticus TaxID=99907 RepID=A0A2T0W6J8_9LACT|nr:hypothetical protein [Alkalibacterium olivapovliticus]PRY82273.1 hypothetical protein CLV38_11310 [Alkalibacterium olivapovliticus]
MIEFFGWKFHFSDNLKLYLDDEMQRMALLTPGDDDIHITAEVINDQLVFNPRWNIKIIFIGDKELKFVTNS